MPILRPLLNMKEVILSELKDAVRELETMKEFVRLVPEVRVNFAYTRENPKEITDVAGVDGRITVVSGMPKAAGKVRFGASDHLARLLIEVAKYDKEMRSAINFKYDEEILRGIKRYCATKKISLGKIDRRREPKRYQKEDKMSMVWKVKTLYKTSHSSIPKIFYETAGWGKEPLFVLLGKNPKEVLGGLKEILRLLERR